MKANFLQNKPFVIAEVGSNWNTFEHAKDSISLAKACGADAVKFQAYTAEALWGNGTHLEGAAKGTIDLEWLPKLAEKAKACNIEFMCSAFSPELLDAVNPFVNIHKLASSEMCHIEMLDRLKSYKKPVIVSTGAQTAIDIMNVINYLEPLPLVMLYCEASYPAKYVDLDVFHKLKQNFLAHEWGYSDHTLDVIETPRAFCRAGAVVIEKHVNFAGVTSPDSPHSLSTDEFKTFVKACRDLLPCEIGPTKAEVPMLLRHKRRVIATSPIKAGDTLTLGKNMGIYRSLKDDVFGAHPFAVGMMNGKQVKRDIEIGDGIAPKDV